MNFREFIRQHFFFRLLFPLVIGIFIVKNLLIPAEYLNWGILIGIFSVMVIMIFPRLRNSFSYRTLFGFSVFLICVALASIRFQQVQNEMRVDQLEHKKRFVVKLVESPVEKAKSYSITVDIKQSQQDSLWQKESAKAILYLQKDSLLSNLKAGDYLMITSSLQQVQNAGNPYEFDYVGYLETKHILYSSYLRSESWKKLDIHSYSLKDRSWNWRNQLLSIYKENGISDESFDILAALTLGYKSTLDPEVRRAWADAGAMHVLAVSGLHVGIIYLVMSWLLSFLANKKWGNVLRGILLLVSLWFYALLTGLSPSVMRASCMFSFIVFGQILNRRGNIYNSLAASAFFLLLYDPYLLFTVGFQFSYLAVVGIVFLQPKFDQLLYVPNVILNKIWQLTTVSFAAQLATFPLSIYYFNQFPTYFLLSGYIVISMAGILIYLSAVLLIFSPIEWISNALGWTLQKLVAGMNWAIVQIQELPAAVFRNLQMSDYQMILLYLLLLSGILIFIFKKKKAVFVLIVILIGIKLPDLYELYQKSEKEMIVFNAGKNSCYAFTNGKLVSVFIDPNMEEKKLNRILNPYLLNHKLNIKQIDTLPDICIKSVGKNRIAIVNKRMRNLDQIIDSLNIDLLVLRKLNRKNIKNLIKNENCQLILDASLSNYERKLLFSDSIAMNRDIFDVKKSGSYRCDLSSEK